jgi:hypothetical protein
LFRSASQQIHLALRSFCGAILAGGCGDTPLRSRTHNVVRWRIKNVVRWRIKIHEMQNVIGALKLDGRLGGNVQDMGELPLQIREEQIARST